MTIDQVLSKEVGISIFIDLLKQIEAAIFFNARLRSREEYLARVLSVLKKIHALALFYHFSGIEEKTNVLSQNLENPREWLVVTSDKRKEVAEILLAIKREIFKLMEQNTLG